jgi:cyclopropane fatty-acyl-phospholipid synthase-like methyltransferase
VFDCYDLDNNAIEYAKNILNNCGNVNFCQKNAIRLALKKDIKEEIAQEYDLIYSAGLFDYLDIRVASRLVANLRKLLKKDGKMVIANFGDKRNNSSAGLMEWVTEWYLIYRNEAEFRKIFVEAGIPAKDVQIESKHDNVVLYSVVNGK